MENFLWIMYYVDMLNRAEVGKLFFYCHLSLLLAAIILGLSFVAQKEGMCYVGPFTFNTLRFLIGSFSLLAVIWAGSKYPLLRKGKHSDKELLKGGLLTGFVLFIAFTINQYCMIFAHSGKAGFITSLYVIFVPLMYVFLGHRLSRNVKIGLVLAILGLYLLCVDGGMNFHPWDVGLLISAFFFAVHIIIVSFYTKKVNAVKLSCAQFAVAGIMSLPLMFLLENPALSEIYAGIKPILFIGIIVTAVAYTLQIFGQKAVKPVTATMILSSESIFAVLGGWILLGDTLNCKEIVGCVLMIAAIILSQLPVKYFQHRQR